MKKSNWPEIPKYKRAENSLWLQYIIVLGILFIVAALGLGIGFANADTVEATQPDPRIEWVSVDISGMRLYADSTHISVPLPPGSWVCVPVKMKLTPATRRHS